MPESKVSIVIPVYNHYALTNKMLYSLQKKEKESIGKILVIDDCSPDEEVQTGLAWWKSQWDVIEVVRNETNLGFLQSSNKGMKMVTENPDEIVILLSNDVEIYGSFIWQIQEHFQRETKKLVGGVIYTHDTGWNKFGDKIYPYVEGWLLATTKANWEELGYFDERYSPCDFEDVDLSTQARRKFYTLVALNSPALRHIGGQSIGYNPKREEQTKINQKKFEDKWTTK